MTLCDFLYPRVIITLNNYGIHCSCPCSAERSNSCLLRSELKCLHVQTQQSNLHPHETNLSWEGVWRVEDGLWQAHKGSSCSSN